MLNTQFRIVNLVVLFVAAVLCFSWIPIILARNLENSNKEVHDGLSGGPGKANNNQFSSEPLTYYGVKRNLRSLVLNPKEYQQKSHGKAPVSMDIVDFLLEYEEDDRSKRFDDYGHMRFGKRGGEEQFDDYGHMRFGRSV